jgi:hypothetical protein
MMYATANMAYGVVHYKLTVTQTSKHPGIANVGHFNGSEHHLKCKATQRQPRLSCFNLQLKRGCHYLSCNGNVQSNS